MYSMSSRHRKLACYVEQIFR